MARRYRPLLVHSACRRCGAAVVTARRALVLPSALKAQYDRICGACWTAADAAALDVAARECAGRASVATR